MNTKVNAIKFAKQLRAELKKAVKQHKEELRQFHCDVDTWREKLAEWCFANSAVRVGEITINEIKNRYRGKDSPIAFSFHGAPCPPIYPTDARIRKIRATLHHLGITGQKDLNISTDEVQELVGEGEEDE